MTFQDLMIELDYQQHLGLQRFNSQQLQLTAKLNKNEMSRFSKSG